MPIICWGNLAKAADDTLRIEQSIQDYVEGHNENENAHQIEGSSLYMHRVQEKLDHLFDSIDWRYLPASKILITSCFESVDGWLTSGSFLARLLGARLYTTAVANNESFTDIENIIGEFALDFTKNPFFQTSLWLSYLTSQQVFFGCGDWTQIVGGDAFGFKVDNGTLYAITLVSGTVYQTQITGIALDTVNVYRAYFDSTENKIYFYVNGVLKHTQTTNLPSAESGIFFMYFIKTLTNAVRSMYIADFVFEQDR